MISDEQFLAKLPAYSAEDLQEISRSLDRERYPERFRALQAELEIRSKGGDLPSQPAHAARLGPFPYVVSCFSFIPLLGVLIGLLSIVYGATKWNRGGGWLVAIGSAGIGFTILLYGGLFYYANNPSSGPLKRPSEDLSRQGMVEIIRSVELHKVAHGRYPDSLPEITGLGAAFAHDPIGGILHPGGRRYAYRNLDSIYWLFSKGHDGIEGTSDDIFPDSGQIIGKVGLRLPPRH